MAWLDLAEHLHMPLGRALAEIDNDELYLWAERARRRAPQGGR